jgi:mannose-6-phosphate isomerase-like protein (cupin superfamily)
LRSPGWQESQSEQQRHEHPDSEQAYVIVAGRGLMFAGDER